MTLAEIVDNRRTIFSRPSTIRDINRGRNIVEVSSFQDIVPALEQRRDDETILITQDVNIIPRDESGAPQYYSAQNFSKRGPLIRLRTYGVGESIKRKWDPLKALIEANERFTHSPNQYVGWYWTDPEGYTHIVQPWMVLEGRRLEMFARKSQNIQDKIEIRKGKYHAKDSHLRAARVLVPSRSGAEKHDIILEHLTDPKDPSRHVEWMRFSTRHECGFKRGNFGFRFRKSVTYCPHDVAAHVAYSREVYEKTRLIIPQPFPLFTEPMLRLYLSAIYDAMIRETIDNAGHTRTRPLSFPEINPILMDARKRYGNKQTFFVKQKGKRYQTKQAEKSMHEYNWQNSAPGMQFL